MKQPIKKIAVHKHEFVVGEHYDIKTNRSGVEVTHFNYMFIKYNWVFDTYMFRKKGTGVIRFSYNEITDFNIHNKGKKK